MLSSTRKATPRRYPDKAYSNPRRPLPRPDGAPRAELFLSPSKTQLATVRIAEDEELQDEEGLMPKPRRRQNGKRRERDAAAQALTLEMMGDLPFAEDKPPENDPVRLQAQSPSPRTKIWS